MNEYKLQRLKDKRKEIRELLALFERAAFRPDDGNNGGDPTAALNGIYETRINLQTKGAAFLSDENAATFFKKLQDQLLDIENEVRKKYPLVMDLAIQWRGKPINTQKRIASIRQTLGEKYQEAADVYDSPEKAHPILSQLDKEIDRLIESEENSSSQEMGVATVQEINFVNEKHVVYPSYLREMYELLIHYFNESELDSICFNLSVDYESLHGRGKADKARDLVRYCRRHDLITSLKTEAAKQRPHVSWPDIPQSSLPE